MTRLIGSASLPMLDPFLLLDEFRSDDPDDYVAGFPDHPHRGFETVTYMLAGRMRHKDNKGHEGVIGPGGIQWMRAGGGIVHSEMPEQVDGLMWGYQLWINLPAAMKMAPAGYQEFEAAQIPTYTSDDGATVRVIAGTSATGVTGPIEHAPLAPLYLDFELPPDAGLLQGVDPDSNAFIYLYDGSAEVLAPPRAGKRIGAGQVNVLGAGDTVHLRGGDDTARGILLAARPVNEPVARGGPFVMNTRDEILQAFEDYQAGRF
ncbi:MAG: pirin family protein [Gammaproteobacteria bacterium]|nr:pirin family protein [Gammaproteobacteria bacterium]